MRFVETYVGFHAPSTESIWARMGHVEVWGYTMDQTWVFIDPRAPHLDLIATHHHDEVTALLSHRFDVCSEIWRLSERRTLRIPLLGPFTCIGVVAATIGVRAYTFAGLKKRLRVIGAEKIHEGTIGKRRGQESPDTGASSVAFGAGPGGAENGAVPHQ